MSSKASVPHHTDGGPHSATERENLLLEAIRRAEAAKLNFGYQDLDAWLSTLADGVEFVDGALEAKFAAQEEAQRDLDVMALLLDDTLASIKRPRADVRALVTRIVRFAFLSGATWGKAEAINVPEVVARQVDRRRARIANYRLRRAVLFEVTDRAKERQADGARARRVQGRIAGQRSAAVRATKREAWQAIARPIAMEIYRQHGDIKREAFLVEIRGRWPDGDVVCPKRSRMSRFLVELFGPARSRS